MELKLPTSVVGYDDLKRLSRALGLRDSQFVSSGAANAAAPPPVAEKLLESLASLNQVDLMDRTACSQLRGNIDAQINAMPQLHISFAVEPSADVVEKILDWLRRSIHPNVLLTIGMQPAIAAGCVLRGPNKVFDMSLRSYIKQQDEYLLGLVKGAASGVK